jgi:hypothetical protein
LLPNLLISIAAQTPLLIDEKQSWWEIGLQAGAAASTIAVAWFAGVQLWRERRASRDRQRAAETRLAALAFLLRRQLRSWLGIDPPLRSGFETWLRNSQNNGTLARQLDEATSVVQELLELAGDVVEEKSLQLQALYVTYLAGTNRLNEYVATPRQGEGGNAFLKWHQLGQDAQRELEMASP